MFFFLAGAELAIGIRFERERWKSFRWGICFAWLACAVVIAVSPFSPRWAKGRLEVSVLDVGQGDSLFVVSPGGKTMLIDGGGAFGGFATQETSFGAASFGAASIGPASFSIDPGEEAVSPYLWSRGFQKLDVIALTHAHQDHLGGLTAILEHFHVGQLWIGRQVSSTGLAGLEQLARDRRIPVKRELRGKSFDWNGIHGDFLAPEASVENAAASPKNDDSLLLRLQFGDRAFLLPGDAEKQTEHEILTENAADALRSDVLKIAHHGGNNSTTLPFLDAVRPQIGIISVGEANPYGHPSPELLECLEAAGVRILRTDRDGAVHVLTNGRQLEIHCFVACLKAGKTAPSTFAKVPNHK